MDSLARTLAKKNFGVDRGELTVEGIPVGVLAEKYGTPVFIYSRKVLDEKLDALRQALPPHFSVFYSVKANPNEAILRHFLSRGCGLEVASAGELRLAIDAGCPPALILFAGPGKTEAELEFALLQGNVEIHLESLTEARRIAEISRRLEVHAKVAVRVNPTGEAEGGAMRMGGRATPFGVDEETLHDVLDVLLADQSLEFRGIHLFTGTQILESSVLVSQYHHGLGIARHVAQRVGHPLHTIDFGGGLGIPIFPHESDLDLESLQRGMAELFATLEADPAFAGTRFVIEPGRYLVGEAGIYISRVIDIKVSRGKKFLILDGGMHHHLAASGNLGQTIKRNYPVAIANKLFKSVEETVDVVGPLCTPLDTLARNVSLPKAEIGDLFVIFQSGAYARSASPLGFLSHPTPPEVWMESGSHVTRPQQTQCDDAGIPIQHGS